MTATQTSPFCRTGYLITIHIVTCLTEGNDRIRDSVAPFLVTVTIGLYGYEANNGMRGYVATG
jgi:hypothetical protein